MIETRAKLIKKTEISPHVFEMTMECEEFDRIFCGQFLNVAVGECFTLKRPFGIIDFDEKKQTVAFAFRASGSGTVALSQREIGWQTKITLPLGNGFYFTEKKVAMVGGGIGVFPLLSVLKMQKDMQIYTFLGYNNAQNAYYLENFKQNSTQTFVCSDDGSIGEKQFVTTLFEQQIDALKPEIVLACGPKPMLKALKPIIQNHNLKCLASTEERMGCGVGACRVCTCKINENGNITNKRVCMDGPVFDLRTLEF